MAFLMSLLYIKKLSTSRVVFTYVFLVFSGCLSTPYVGHPLPLTLSIYLAKFLVYTCTPPTKVSTPLLVTTLDCPTSVGYQHVTPNGNPH